MCLCLCGWVIYNPRAFRHRQSGYMPYEEEDTCHMGRRIHVIPAPTICKVSALLYLLSLRSLSGHYAFYSCV